MKFVAATARDVRAGGQIGSKPVPSPCMSVCQMDEASGLCQGCARTMEEIQLWGNADDAFKRRVWSDIEGRITLFLA